MACACTSHFLFINYFKRLFKMLNRLVAAQVCDARNDEQNYKSWLHKHFENSFKCLM
jgi:hypothetical protein